MPDTKYLIDYNEFMYWFATRYPALFKEYASNITGALDDTGLKIRIGNLDHDTYNLIFAIQNEFYSLPRLGH